MVDDVQSGASWWNQVWLPRKILYKDRIITYMIPDMFHDKIIIYHIHSSWGCSFPVWLQKKDALAINSDWDQQCLPSHAASKGSCRGHAQQHQMHQQRRTEAAHTAWRHVDVVSLWSRYVCSLCLADQSFVCQNFYHFQMVVWRW